MKRCARRALPLLLAVTTWFLVIGSVAQAAAPEPVKTLLTLEPVPPLRVGEPATISAFLTTSSGEPIFDVGVEFFVDGLREGRARTDSEGRVSLVVRRELVAANYELGAVFNGVPNQGLEPSSSSAEFTIHPAVLEIQTVPPLPGASFSLVPDPDQDDDSANASAAQTFVSDEAGLALVGIEKLGLYIVEALPWESPDPGVRAVFSRWVSAFTPSIQVNISSATTRLDAGFDVSHLVDLSFVDSEGQAIEPERVESITLKSTLGGSVTFDEVGSQWLQSGRVVRRADSLDETQALYSIQSVIVRGSNLVNRSQQQFTPNEEQEWQIELILYSAHISVRDALFRFPLGSSILLEFPDGRTERFPLESGGELTLDSLPRGEYRVSVDGPGISFSKTVALSRNQDVRLEFISYLDIAVASLSAIAVSLGLLFLGRPQLLVTLRAHLRWGRRALGGIVGRVLARPMMLAVVVVAVLIAIAAEDQR